ncbi:tetratricopeptide repeat protein [Adhaeretor mobilis]|uniref:Uncharacterized protein n=1 Tax=Adhaeretor mobilis TaxID=1930276 RepID=A0A517MYR5_9BACT|nr:tetratricopeptide repeat protein [Adhaeretor mobilis]QDT00031.1 hypothetical protein HG15A2_33660 [Adhaeretor mobilis]
MNRTSLRSLPTLRLFLTGLSLVLISEPVIAQGALDRVRRRSGVDTGKIEGTSPQGIKLSRGGVEKQIPTEDIVSVYFSGEPPELNAARLAVERGKYKEALRALKGVNTKAIRRDEVRSEVAFVTALANARLALAGQGDLGSSQGELKSFLSSNRSSIQVLPAFELIGDLALADEDYQAARENYGKLARVNSPYYKLRSSLLIGRSWQAEGDDAKASAAFESVVSSAEKGAVVEPIKLAATLELAVSKAAGGDVKESVATLQKIIAEADPQNDADLLAQAYNALGGAYLKAGDKQAALFAFLRVDLIYPTSPEQHARALFELKSLWQGMGKADRAEQAAKKLADQYPSSRWASR